MRVKDAANYPQSATRFVGSHYTRLDPKFGMVACRWPKKRGSAATPAQRQARDEFTQAVYWAKRPLGSDVEVAQAVTTGTGYLIRDLIESAIFGKVAEIYMKDGRVLKGWRVVATEIQEALDTITTDVGAILVRGPDGWIGLDPGFFQQMILSNGPGQVPAYGPPPFPAGTQYPQATVMPIVDAVAVSTSAFATKGQIYGITEQITITSLWASIFPTIGQTYQGSLAILDGGSISPKITAITHGPARTWTGTATQQTIQLPMSTEFIIPAETWIAILVTVTSGTGSTSMPIATGTNTTMLPLMPGYPGSLCRLASTEPAVGNTLDTFSGTTLPNQCGFTFISGF
jgi:hypothetical protein